MIDTIGSDHSPCPPAMKGVEAGDFMGAWGGIASLQLVLSIVWTCASARTISLDQVFKWLSSNPARLVGLEGRKGRLAAGYDADMVVFDPDARWNVHGNELQHRHKLTPYDGAALRGKVQRTYLRGQKIFDQGEFRNPRHGELLSATDV